MPTVVVAEVLQERVFLLGVLALGLGLWGFFRRRPDENFPNSSTLLIA